MSMAVIKLECIVWLGTLSAVWVATASAEVASVTSSPMFLDAMELDVLSMPKASALLINVKFCDASKDCQSCIKKADCGWCMPGIDVSLPYCVDTKRMTGRKCAGTLYDPKGNFSSSASDSVTSNHTMIVTPKQFDVKLRVGATIEVPLQLKVLREASLDLYYLTDISMSMRDDLDMLKKLGVDIKDELTSLTDNSNLGFGTFIDKKMLPYWDPYNTGEIEPTDACHATYGFCNALALSSNEADLFTDAVSQAKVGSNKDLPEGGLDALMQVLTCTDQINWRDTALKLVLFTSDSAFHYAGDGKLAGIDKPNDGLCHLNKTGSWYTHSKLQDYPSVYQITTAASDNGIYVIFAVTRNVLPLYEKLLDYNNEFKVAEIRSDSSNIIEIISESFHSIKESFILNSEAPLDVEVSFTYSCPNKDPSSCSEVILGGSYDIIASVTLKECPDTRSNRDKIFLSSTSLEENIVLNLDYICDCDCNKNIEIASSHCSGSGTYRCGECFCNDGFYGDTCLCQGSSDADNEACRYGSLGDVCDGHGACVCGKCTHCDNKYYGEYCECTDDECPTDRGLMCGGHGNCKCNQCECHEGWSDKSCNCSTSTNNCINPDSADGLACSGHGDCLCNYCECALTGKNDNEQYFGKWCHDCPSCGGECVSLDACVRCYLLESGDSRISSVNADDCDKYQATCKEDIAIKEVTAEENSLFSSCSLMENDCTRKFYYLKSTHVTQVYISSDWSCQLQTWVIALSVAGGIVLLGIIIALIVWFWLRYLAAIEAKKFTAETSKAMETADAVHLNQLYRNPVSDVTNPMYVEPDASN